MPSHRRLKFFPVFMVLLFLGGALTAQTKSDDLAKLKGFESFVNSVLAEHKVPGVAVAVVKDGKLLYAQGFGYRDVQAGLKVTPHTLFGIGSCSKAFTAVTMGMLIDEGKLEWGKPVRAYLPAFQLSDPLATETMTPRDLVLHRTGLPRHDKVWYKSPLSRKELFDRLRYLDFSRGIREVYQYNNLMYMTAGVLVETVAGMPWEDFAKGRILDPLGMSETNFAVADSQKSADFANPYQIIGGAVQLIPFCNVDAIAPAGAINSSVSDMARWVLLNLNKGRTGEKPDKRIVSESVLGQIQTPQIIVPEEWKHEELFYGSYAMGWRVNSYRGHLLVYHGGSIDGFTALVSLLPKDNIGLVILNNLESGPINYILAYNLYDRLLGLKPVDWAARTRSDVAKSKDAADKAKKEREKDRKPGTLPTHPLKDYAGDFDHPAYGRFTIRMEGDRLAADFHGLTYGLTHFHYDTFELKNDLATIDAPLMFLMDARGDIGSLAIKLEPAVKEIVFARAAPKGEEKK
jgi:CubicO group peptidase (beta-lactamase class C family)